MDGSEESAENPCATPLLYHTSLLPYMYIPSTWGGIYIARLEHKNAKAHDQAKAFSDTNE